MYYFNHRLIEELPKLFGMPKYKLSQMSGLGYHCLSEWANSASMPVLRFVEFLNFHHLSMADFLVTTKTPVLNQRKEDYVIPDEIWKPIEWHCEKMSSVYGNGGLTGVKSKDALAKSLGFANASRVVAWATNPESMKMSTLINLLNMYSLDAKIFLVDNNRPIASQTQDIKNGGQIAVEVESIMSEVKILRSQLKDRDSLIAKIQQDKDRLQRENEKLRRVEGSDAVRTGVAADSALRYGNPFVKPKLVFHRELWEQLPEVFGMTDREFRQRFGLHPRTQYGGDIGMDKLIEVCNELHVSITHFFPFAGEPLVVNHRTWYEISPRLFKPVLSRMENLKYIFKKSTFGLSRGQLEVSEGIRNRGFNGFMKEGNRGRTVLTVLNICNSFSLPISVFVSDSNNRKRPSYSISLNETLIENCVEMSKALEKCREEIRKLEAERRANKGNC